MGIGICHVLFVKDTLWIISSMSLTRDINPISKGVHHLRKVLLKLVYRMEVG
jgi:hypothetical protein